MNFREYRTGEQQPDHESVAFLRGITADRTSTVKRLRPFYRRKTKHSREPGALSRTHRPTDATYAERFSMSSCDRFATTCFINGDQVPFRLPCWMSQS